ncbi:WG repeat-containing protein [Chryseobacterium viscerum]|uniref:WG repeat-containing protein n=1 Tax=Chryseobacterium viscerum TaxID=1037377 RepID=A0A316WH16_9FLAO|nr:WG repeat-containing protein [Chryseobacterium viscerum]PWN60765.1 WG repeat-containing protein [Chryseobacterium viscerum]
MKKILLAIILTPIIYFSQSKEDLHYFKSKDSLVGVKDKAGKIIVPAQFKIFSFLKDGDPVEGETILFDGSKEGEKYQKNTWGYVYDRKGNFLYTPFLYDNGADYFSEGVRRLVKNGKVGFADRNGKIVIEAEHDFASPFNYGYAAFCDGCDWEKTNDEHRSIVGGKWGVMNVKGETVQPLEKPTEKDVEIDGKYYPNPFQYNGKEKNMLQFFEKQNKKLADLYYVNVYNELSENEKNLLFEIVERPKENFPYYQVNTYDYRKKDLGMLTRFKFLVSEDGKAFYAIEDYNEERIPFGEWLKNEIESAEQYQKEHPDNPNKFIN